MLSFIQSLSRSQKRAVMLALDVITLPLAFLFAILLQALPMSAEAIARDLLTVLPYMLAILVGLAYWLGLHKVRLKDFEGRNMLRFAVYSAVSTLLFVPVGQLSGLGLPLSTYMLHGFTFFVMGTVARFTMRTVLIELYNRAGEQHRVLIYGAGTTGTELVAALRTHGAIRPVAFIDDNSSLQGMNVAGLPVYAPAKLSEIVEEHAIDRILLAIPSISAPKQTQIARKLQATGVEVQVLPSFSQLIGQEPLLDRLVNLPGNQFLGRSEVVGALGDRAITYAGKSVLISGAGGTIGAELSRQILACQPRRLVMFELSEFALYTIDQELRSQAEEAGVELVPVLGSVSDAALVRRVLAEQAVEIVLHAAAYKHVPLVEHNPLAGIANNVVGTQVIARESAEAGIERFTLVSSDKAVRPLSMMGATKRLSELVIQDLARRVPPGEGPRFSIVRFGNVLGSSGSVVPLFKEQIRAGGPVTVTHRNVTRYFMTVQEAVQLVLTAGAMAEGGEVYVLDMGQPVSILQLARHSIEAAGYTVRDRAHPEGDIEIAITGLRPGEKLHEELTITAPLQPTSHGKINMVREAALSELETARVMRLLKEAVTGQDPEAARHAVALAVEGFAAAPERAVEVL